MNKYEEKYSKLSAKIQENIDRRETNKSTWVATDNSQINQSDRSELQKLCEKAKLENWNSFIGGTEELLKLGRATYQLQRDQQSASEQLNKSKKAISQIEKLLNTFLDDAFPNDSQFNSYLYLTENEADAKQDFVQATDIRTHLSKTIIALSMFSDDHVKNKGRHKNNYDFFIIELSRLFKKHSGKISKHAGTHFYSYVSICMEAIGNKREDYEPIIKKALKQLI